MENEKIEKLLKDLIYINGVIATELIQITENTSAALRGSVPKSCKKAHNALRNDILKILDEETPALVENLRNHLTGH